MSTRFNHNTDNRESFLIGEFRWTIFYLFEASKTFIFKPEFFQMTKTWIRFADWIFQGNISKRIITRDNWKNDAIGPSQIYFPKTKTRMTKNLKKDSRTNLIRYSPVIGLIGSAKTWLDSRTSANWDNSDFNISHFSVLSAFIASLFTSF